MKKLKITVVLILLSEFVFAQNPLVKQWDKRFGGTGWDYVTCFQQTHDGGYILGGYSSSGIGGDKTQDTIGSWDYWIIKIDSLGDKQWDKDFGGTSDDYLTSLEQTSDAGYILGGYSASGISGDKTQSLWDTCTNCPYQRDYWIVKTDSLGIKQWDKDFGGMNADYLYSLQQTADGGYILGGYSWSDSSGDKTQVSWGQNDYWLVKTDSLGNKEWDSDFGGTSDDRLYSLQQTADNGYVLGGFSYSGISGNKSQATWGEYDYWIVKTDSLGNKQWDKDLGGTSYDYLYSLGLTFDGGYILGGYSTSGIGGDKTQASWGFEDYWIVKIDFQGNVQWDKDLGGTNQEDEFGNISQTADSGYLITGTSYSDISGDKTEINLGNEQTWVIKTNSLGIKQWDKTLHTNGHDEIGFAIETKNGCYAIENWTIGEIAGDKTEASWGYGDYWIIKFCDTTLTTNLTPALSNEEGVAIAPNPFTDKLTISTNSNSLSEIILYDIASRKLLQQKFTGSVTLNTAQLAKGIYIYEVRGNPDSYREGVKKGKVVKE